VENAAGNFDMEHSVNRKFVPRMISALVLMLLATVALAQTLLQVVELCNGADRSSPDPQIYGCTTLIDSGAKPNVLTIAYNNRGDAYIAKGEYDRAIQDFDESIKLASNNAKAFNNRGVAYQKKGEHDRAIQDFDESIKLSSDYASPFANRAEAYLTKGEYGRAARDYNEAIRLQPSWSAAWNGRCWTRAIVGELQAALADCNESLRLEPNVAATFDSRGLVYLKLGQWESAIADYSSALRFDAKASALYGRGFAKLKKGDTGGGNADIAAAKAIEANIVGRFAQYGVR
jgi:tetratricopeptide (TPR) repeat protein